MTAITHLQPLFVTSFPTPMDQGYLYVSIEYNSCGHLCACGCDHEIITPLSPAQWAISYDGETISLNPSIGNWTLLCRSHYFVQRGRIRWARDYSEYEITRDRLRDQALLERRQNGAEPELSTSIEIAQRSTRELEADARRSRVSKRALKPFRAWLARRRSRR